MTRAWRQAPRSNHWLNKSVKWSGTACYNAFPASLDPDQPLSNWLYKASVEYMERAASTWRLGYTLSYLNAIDNPRTDIKNKIRFKMTFHPSPAFTPGFSLGAGYGSVSGGGYDYYETDASVSGTYAPDDKNMLLAMLYVDRRTYLVPETSKGGAAGGMPKKGKGSTDIFGTTGMSALSLAISLSWSRELSNHLEAEAGYDLLSFASTGSQSSASHKIGIGLTWRLNPL